MHALQEGGGDAAVANPGSAYGASALGPSAGGGADTAPGNADTQPGTQVESMPSQPVQDDDTRADGYSEKGSEQQGLSLPFDPVSLVFKDVHYFVKRPDNKSEELELLKASSAFLLFFSSGVENSEWGSSATPVFARLQHQTRLSLSEPCLGARHIISCKDCCIHWQKAVMPQFH